MKYRTRTYYTDAQKALMWERWKQGWTLHQIAHLFDQLARTFFAQRERIIGTHRNAIFSDQVNQVMQCVRIVD